MNRRIFLAIVAASLLAPARAGDAQSAAGDVTLKVPLNLTRLSTDIAKVAIVCNINSSAIRAVNADGTEVTQVEKREELAVSGGQLVTTVTVVVAIPTLVNPAGQTAGYKCTLFAYSTSQSTWGSFSDSATIAAFRLSPTPMTILGSFTW